MTQTIANKPILATEDELPLLRALAARLDSGPVALLLGPDDEPIELPHSAFQTLTSAIPALAKGGAVTVVATDAILTPLQVAEFLLVSLPFVDKMLETAEIPSFIADTRRYVRVADILAFREKSIYRIELLNEMLRDAQDMGLYDEDYPPPADDEDQS